MLRALCGVIGRLQWNGFVGRSLEATRTEQILMRVWTVVYGIVETGRIRASRSGTGCKLSRSVRDTYVSAARLIIPDD